MATRSGAVYGPDYIPVTVNSQGALSYAGSYPPNVASGGGVNFDWRTYLVPVPSSVPQVQPLYAECMLYVIDNRLAKTNPTDDLTVLVHCNNDGYLPVEVPISIGGTPVGANASFKVPGQLDTATVADLNRQVNALWAQAGQERPY